MTSDHSLTARGLRKRYQGVDALDDLDLDVEAGTIHGLLGPNGAGKSTLVRALATLIDLDSGSAQVAGHDVRTQPDQVRRSIGLVGQSAALDEILGGRQNLVMFGRLYGLSARQARARADELLGRFDLEGAADRAVGDYSGGMRRRLDIAASLILTPAVLFLDEPTTGLDPRGRNEVWQTVRQVAAQGTTVLLTTQYLDEADQLAGRITVLNHGRVVAEGTPDALKRQIGGDRVTVTLAPDQDLDPVAADLTTALGRTVSPDADAHTLTLQVEDHGAGAGLVDVVRALDAAGADLADLVLRRPTLDEVFLALTDKEPAR